MKIEFAGIGYETAKGLARCGATVVVACRDLRRAQEAVDRMNREIGATSTGSLQVLQLDLASFRSIRKFDAEFESRFTRLDILVNNAGLGCIALFASTRPSLKLLF